MNWETGMVLGLLLVSVALFSFEWVAPELVAMGLLAAFVFTGILSPEQAFAGFASDTVILILGLLLMTAVLTRSGLMELVARRLLRATGGSPARFRWMLMLASGTLSAFVSNTATTALFVPVALGVARRLKLPPSQFLLPLAFASILSSCMSLIATSTNLVVSGMMQRLGLDGMGMFELTPVGLPILVIGLAYLGLAGWRLIPQRGFSTVEDELQATVFLAEIIIMPGSSFAGKTLEESRLGADHDLSVIRIAHADGRRSRPRSQTVLQSGDIVLVEANQEALLRVKALPGIELKPEVKLSALADESLGTRVVEAVVLPGSTVIGKSLRELRFRDRFGVIALALQHHGRSMEKLSGVRIAVGDVLLLQGPSAELSALQEMHAFRLIGEADAQPMPRRRAWMAAAIFAAALLAGIFHLAPLPVAVFSGAVLMLATCRVSPDAVYRDVEWKAVLLIACMLSLGAAMQATGTDRFIGQWISGLTSGWAPLWLMGGFFLITVALSQPMSNQAAAALMLPVAVATAHHTGVNPRAFAMAVAIASSCSYLTPLEPSCLMVYGPGRYRFRDFFIVGLPLTVVIFILTLVMVPVLWPF